MEPVASAEPSCNHHEGATNKAGRYVDLHDCRYVGDRNRCIDQAYREARAEAFREGLKEGGGFDNVVTRYFCRNMNSAMNTPNWDTEDRRKAEARRPPPILMSGPLEEVA